MSGENKMGKNHKAEYNIYNKDTGKLIGSAVIRSSWDGKDYVDVYNGDRNDKYGHDHAWSSIGRENKDDKMGYHGFRQKK